MTDIYWTFEFNGARLDLECMTKQELQHWVDEWFAGRFEGDPMKNGETRSDEGFIIEFHYDDDGEFVEIKREKYRLRYEYYHGDFKEHNTYGR